MRGRSSAIFITVFFCIHLKAEDDRRKIIYLYNTIMLGIKIWCVCMWGGGTFMLKNQIFLKLFTPKQQ